MEYINKQKGEIKCPRLRIWKQDLPPALSQEENAQLIEAYRQTEDKKARIKIRDKIVYGNLRLVIKALSKTIFEKDDWTREDFLQEGIFTMLKAIDEYDPEKGAFSTFLTASLINSFKTLRKQQQREKVFEIVSLNQHTSKKDPKQGPTIEDVLKEMRFDEKMILDSLEIKFLFEKILPKFSDFEQEIFKQHFVERKTLREIAENVGLTHQFVSQELNRMVADIKAIYFEGDEAEIGKRHRGRTQFSMPENPTLEDVLSMQSKRDRDIFRKYQKGMTVGIIAEEKQVSKDVVKYTIKKIETICKDANVEMPEIKGKKRRSQPGQSTIASVGQKPSLSSTKKDDKSK